MIILGIESSCDDTSVAVLKDMQVLSNIVFSQDHKKFGGVYPEYASREHLNRIKEVFEKALSEANISINEIDIVAATHSPGLIGSLLVGHCFGKALAYGLKRQFVSVHHIKAHVYAAMIENKVTLPALALVVSGGHTSLIYLDENHNFTKLGNTLDDAAGEAYDKVGRMLGLSYPAGREIDELSKVGEANIKFPCFNDASYNFSFSGLKSAVYRYLEKYQPKKENVAASFQKAIENSIIPKAVSAFKSTKARTFILCGGVAANSGLRHELKQALGDKVVWPSVKLCLDNGAMIAAAANFMIEYGKVKEERVTSTLEIEGV